MDRLYKISLIFVALVVFSGLGFIIYKQYEISKRQEIIEKNMIVQKQLDDSITRSSSSYASKEDLEKFIKDSGVDINVIKKDISTFEANIIAAINSSFKSNGYSGTSLPSSSIDKNSNPNTTQSTTSVICDGKKIDCPNPDKYGVLRDKSNFNLEEKFPLFSIPFGNVSFSGWQQNPWGINVYERDYSIINVLSQDEDGKLINNSKFSITTNGKKYDIQISDSKLIQEVPSEKMSWWNPRLALGISGGYNISNPGAFASPSINVQLMSYGKFKFDPTVSFIQIGVGYDTFSKKTSFELTPVAYNVGKHIPLMRNLYIGPTFGANTDKSFMVGLGLRSLL